ncbi:uncharacterized protein [Arachis hypogaea]|uniref:uncharacterized protein n=1 Tax=Arachis hypogaea TaxID=3818 RepID=UPI003B222584
MVVVLRFVDVNGFVRERFFDLVHLALVAASREVLQIHEFFTQLTAIINIVGASCKRHDQLQEAQEIENAKLVANDELEIGQGADQVGTLQRARDTRWSSHFHSICGLIRIFAVTRTILNNIIDDSMTSAQRGEAYDVNKNICKLAEKFYPSDFFNHERILLNAQLQHYAFDIPNHLKDVGTLFELCQRLKETENSRTYHLVDRLIRNVLTLSVSTATTERAFSVIKIVKTRLRSKMANEFLADNLVIYIEKEIAATFSTYSITDDFESRKKCRTQLSMKRLKRNRIVFEDSKSKYATTYI